MTRQRILAEAKDKWIPEPQIGERRDAKRCGSGTDFESINKKYNPSPAVIAGNASSPGSGSDAAAVRGMRTHAREAPLATPISARSFSPSSSSSFNSQAEGWCGSGTDFESINKKYNPSPAVIAGNASSPGTRQRILAEAKDKWIPEPQIGERRDAKRVRGWVWPPGPPTLR
jgi:hypothetical protein